MNSYDVKMQNLLDVAAYQRHLWDRPKLKFLFFELTDVCNLNCKHCGSRCTANNTTWLPFEMVEKTLVSVANHYDPSEILVCLTGGEPLLHRDVFHVIRCSKRLGFRCGMTTNGTLITERVAEKLVLSGLDTITVSLDGTKGSHDAFRKQNGSFEKAVQGIRWLKEAGIEPEALTVVHSGNIGQLKDLFSFLEEEQVLSWRLTNVDPIGRAKDSGLLLNGTEWKELLEFIQKMRFDPCTTMDVSYGCAHFLPLKYERMTRDHYFQCVAGTKVGSVMANGDIGACLDVERRLELIQGNIYINDFVDVWENNFQAFRRDRTQNSTVCKNCEYRKVCLGDSAHTWNYDTNEPHYCAIKRMEEEHG